LHACLIDDEVEYKPNILMGLLYPVIIDSISEGRDILLIVHYILYIIIKSIVYNIYFYYDI
ncbi:Transmembrane domain-containing protein, partial [Orpheovirus IHUMI-LCC2]